MKKTAIAFAVAAFATVAVQAAPNADTFYVGARAGWSQGHYDLNQAKDFDPIIKIRHDRSHITGGAYFGYQINDYLATELGYDYFGALRATREVKGVNGKGLMRNHGASFSVKASYPLLENLDFYGRVAAALVRTDYKVNKALGLNVQNQHSLKVSPLFAAGFEYAPMPELGLRLEYSWLNRIGKVEDKQGNRLDFAPRLGAVTVGAAYRFGQSAPVAPVQVSQTFALNSDVTFGFDKADLKAEAEAELNNIYAQIAQVQPEKLTVAGYTDRIGNEAYNQKLSQKRAESVAKFFEAKGVSADIISATGYGEANPVVACEGVRGKKAVQCLAPNRRVEVTIDGTK